MVVLSAAWIVGCDSEMPPDDGGTEDAANVCSTASECDDGLFCNGDESCDPDDPASDAMGCVSGTAPCDADTCSEESDLCSCSTDADEDGSIAIECGGDDCDDNDANRFPDNVEVCDAEGHDEDCDLSTFGDLDADEDGSISDTCCNPSSDGGAPTCGNDCDDARANVSGLATEACDGVDNDCDMETDEGVERTFYPDTDRDSFGDPDGTVMMGCTPPTGFVEDNTDCNDGDVSFNPLAAEQCATSEDEDCDGEVDETGEVRYYRDFDGDDYGATGTFIDSEDCDPPSGYVRIANDCNDMSGAFYPGAPDPCDRRDTDCNLPSTPGGTDLAEDMDDDAHAAIGASCMGEDVGFGVFPKDDCDDDAASTYPGAPEVCDRRDNACAIGGGVLESEDMDGDGHSATDAACSGGLLSRDDCNDAEITVYLGAPELCDRLDNNCSADGGVDVTEDMDDDGHAPIGGACDDGPLEEDDCDDTTATTYPGAPELCNRVDDVCASGGGPRPSEDMDDDGFAPMDATCTGGPRPKTDCNDDDPDAFPGATETCGGGDQNCNSTDDVSDPAAAAWCGPFSVCAGGTTCRLETPLAAGGDLPDRGSTVALRSGTTFGWGAGDLLPGISRQVVPTEIPQLAGATSASLGFGSACAITGGTVECWGRGSPFNGAFSADAVAMPDVAGALEISVGGDSTCARFSSEVRCWGSNGFGGVGDGTTDPRTTPAAAVFSPALAPEDAPVQLASGSSHHCALLRSGSVQCWGSADQGQLGDGAFATPPDARFEGPGPVVGLTDAVSIAATGTYTCAVRSDGTVSCWGTLTVGDFTTGFQIQDATPMPVSGLSDVQQVTMHGNHLCARSGDGTVRCWGEGEANQLGDGLGTSSETPVLVSGLSDATFIAAGGGHTCALRATGDVVCWGANGEGQLGDGTDSGSVYFPVPVGGVSNAIAVFASRGGFCVRRTAGGIECWGNGPLGDGTSDDSVSPVAVTGSTTGVDVAAVSGTTCMRNSGGTVECWGSGPLGSATASSDAPLAVSGISDATVLGDGAEANHNCAFGAAGLRCWGDNTYGQLATGDMVDSDTPVPSAYTFSEAFDIGISLAHTCVAHSGGVVSCLGFNVFGALGNGSPDHSVDPVAVTGITDAVELTSNRFHNCVRHATGAVSCWGNNQNGQLGDGTVLERGTPVAAIGISNAVSLETGGAHTCAALASGEVWCWGTGGGTAFGGPQTTPVQVAGVSSAEQVAVGSRSTCALHMDGTVSCWGIRDVLGNATYATPSTTPVTALLP
ncbi:MAG: MopE-related protein [Sandaracinaceae bacterium]